MSQTQKYYWAYRVGPLSPQTMDHFVDNESGFRKRRRIVGPGGAGPASPGPLGAFPAGGGVPPGPALGLAHIGGPPGDSRAAGSAARVEFPLGGKGLLESAGATGLGPGRPLDGPKKAPFVYDNLQDEAYGTIEDYFKRPARWAKPLLVIGPSGSGKSYIIRHYGTVEAFDDQDLDDFLALHGLRARPVGLIEDIEGLDASERASVKKCLGPSGRPHRRLAFTAEDPYEEPAKSWASHCHVVKLSRPSLSHCIEVLKAHGASAPLAKTIAEASNCNLGSARAGLSLGLTGAPDAPVTCPKAVGALLRGAPVMCLGGSSDISWIHQLYALNCIQVKAKVSVVLRTLDAASFIDIVDHELPSENLWDLVQLMAACGPQSTTGLPSFLWPSAKKAKTFSMTSLKGLVED